MPHMKGKILHNELARWELDVLNCGVVILNPPAEVMLKHTFHELCAWGSSPEGHAAWNRHGRRLIAECVRRAPGTRPWGWWRWEYTERRPWDEPPRRPKGWEPDYHQYDPNDPFESFAILRRLKALLPGEAEAFKAAHPEEPPTARPEPDPMIKPEPMTPELLQ